MTKATMKATATATTIEMTDSSMTEILTGDPLVGVLRQISNCPRDLAFRCAGGGRGSGTQLIKSRKWTVANETVVMKAMNSRHEAPASSPGYSASRPVYRGDGG